MRVYVYFNGAQVRISMLYATEDIYRVDVMHSITYRLDVHVAAILNIAVNLFPGVFFLHLLISSKASMWHIASGLCGPCI